MASIRPGIAVDDERTSCADGILDLSYRTFSRPTDGATDDARRTSEIIRTSDTNLADADADVHHTGYCGGAKHAEVGIDRTPRRRSRC